MLLRTPELLAPPAVGRAWRRIVLTWEPQGITARFHGVSLLSGRRCPVPAGRTSLTVKAKVLEPNFGLRASLVRRKAESPLLFLS